MTWKSQGGVLKQVVSNAASNLAKLDAALDKLDGRAGNDATRVDRAPVHKLEKPSLITVNKNTYKVIFSTDNVEVSCPRI